MNPDSNNFQPGAQPVNPAPAGSTPPTPPVAPQPAPAQPTPTEPTPQPTNPAVTPSPEQEVPLRTDGFPVMPEPPKKKNTTRIALIVVLIIAIIGCGIATAIVLMNPSKGGNPGGSNGNPAYNPSTPDTPDTPDEPSAEEVALTDENTKADIKEKLRIIMGVGWANESLMSTNSIIYDDVQLLKEGDLGQDNRALHIIFELEGATLTEDQIQSILDTNEDYFSHMATAHSSTVEQMKESFKQWSGTSYSGSAVRELYKQTYGEELPQGSDINASNFSCGYLGYNEEHDIYFEGGGCGGIMDQRSYYVDKYTTDETNVYINLYAGLNELEGGIYCDVAVDPTELSDKVCEGKSGTTFIDETNYENFAPYRIIFTKGTDGKYYFSSAEAL